MRFFLPALFSLFLAGCSGPYSESTSAASKEAAPPIAVSTVPVTVSTIPEIITANGELFAEELATVSAKVPGRVVRLFVDLGSAVKAGDPIAELEKTDYEFRVRQAEAMVEQTRARLALGNLPDERFDASRTALVREAEAALKEAQFTFDTTSRLQKDGVVSRIDFEKAQVRRDGAEAHYQAAIAEAMQIRSQLSERRANLALARQQLADCTLHAPFSGAVTRRQASLGEYLASNAPILSMVRQHPLRVRLEVPERLAARVQKGQQIEVGLAGTTVIRRGTLVRISPAIEAQSRSLTIEGEIPNEDGLLRPGSFVDGVITINPAARGIAVPRSAVVSFAGVDRVYVVRDGKLDDRVVRTGRRLPEDQLEILSGLAGGDILVINASDRLSKGQRVKGK